MRSITFIIILSGYLNSSFCQNSPESFITSFFEQYKSDRGEALANLYKTNPWISRHSDAILNIINEVEKLTPDYVGTYYGNKIILQKQLSNSMKLYSYLVKYDRQPIRFTFIFYKPEDTWRLFSFSLDSNLDDELAEAAKLYYVQLGN